MEWQKVRSVCTLLIGTAAAVLLAPSASAQSQFSPPPAEGERSSPLPLPFGQATTEPAPDWLVWRQFNAAFLADESLASQIGLNPGRAGLLRQLATDYLRRIDLLDTEEKTALDGRMRQSMPPALAQVVESRINDARTSNAPPADRSATERRELTPELRERISTAIQTSSAQNQVSRDAVRAEFEERKAQVLADHHLRVIDALDDAGFNALHAWVQANIAATVNVVRLTAPAQAL